MDIMYYLNHYSVNFVLYILSYYDTKFVKLANLLFTTDYLKLIHDFQLIFLIFIEQCSNWMNEIHLACYYYLVISLHVFGPLSNLFFTIDLNFIMTDFTKAITIITYCCYCPFY